MRFTVVFLLFLLVTSCYNVERDCKSFKTGVFKFEELVGTELVSSTIRRNDSISIETYNKVTDTFSVRWINNCEYIMRKLNPKNKYEEEAVHFKILSTTKDSYSFEYRMVVKKENNPRRVEKGTVTKIADL